MVKWLLLACALYILYKLFSHDWARKQKDSLKEDQEERERKIAAGEMVKDPECGVYVAKDSAISIKDGPRQYYFCSYDCRDKFLKRLNGGGASLED